MLERSRIDMESTCDSKTELEKRVNKPSVWPQLFSAMVAGLACAMQGTVYGFPTRALPQLVVEEDIYMRLTTQEASWFAAMMPLCAIILSPLGGILSNWIGRRQCFIFFTSIGTIGWITVALSSNSETLFVGRFLGIIGTGGLSPSVGVHISETVHANLRGSLSVFQSLFISIGMLIVLGLGYFLKDWRTLAWVCMIPGCLHLMLVLFLHDTPYWLMQKNLKIEAMKSLQFYRGRDYDVTEEFEEMSSQNEKKALLGQHTNGWKSNLKRFTSSAFGRPFLCIGVLYLIMQWGEFNNLTIHMISIFRTANSSIEPELAPVFIGCIQVFSAALSSFVMRHVSSKVLFVSCVSVNILADISLATFSYLKANSEENSFMDFLGFLPLVFVICTVSAHSIGVFPIFHLLLGELFPSDIRSLSIGLTISAGLSFGTVNILTYSYLIEYLQFFGTFYFYAAVQFAALLWGFFMIPDNRGLSLAKVEENFESVNNKDKKPLPGAA